MLGHIGYATFFFPSYKDLNLHIDKDTVYIENNTWLHKLQSWIFNICFISTEFFSQMWKILLYKKKDIIQINVKSKDVYMLSLRDINNFLGM